VEECPGGRSEGGKISGGTVYVSRKTIGQIGILKDQFYRFLCKWALLSRCLTDIQVQT